NLLFWFLNFFFFFFQAEDGIRDFHVTGVQTCALPISAVILAGSLVNLAGSPVILACSPHNLAATAHFLARYSTNLAVEQVIFARSEERRVGKECRSRVTPSRQHKNTSTKC